MMAWVPWLQGLSLIMAVVAIGFAVWSLRASCRVMASCQEIVRETETAARHAQQRFDDLEQEER